MKYFLATLMLFLTTSMMFAQVGIGNTSPTAQLEIATTNTGIPALELNPQSAPVGDTTGQLAVIGDELYMYDAARAKWLSLQATPLQWGKRGNNISGENLQFGGDISDDNSGAYMPLNGTIVYISATSSGGNSSKGFDVRIKTGNSTISTTSFNLVSNVFRKTDYNVDFNAGYYINVSAQNAGNSVVDPTVIVWVKWRK
jgi:hypothetical protein